LIVIEFVSGDGEEEKDNSPPPEGNEVDPKTKKVKKAGKFWVYEQAVKIPYYAIFNGFEGTLEMYHLEKGRYKQVKANRRNHYPIPELGVELGILLDQERPPIPWLRWWDNRGNLLLTGNERAEQECQRRELAEAIAIQERQQKEMAEALAIQERTEKEQERQQKELAKALAIQERAEKEQERQQKELAEAIAVQEREKKEKLAAYLRSLGINPDEI
jgi:flagellar biosynthesis GTPase FlhF